MLEVGQNVPEVDLFILKDGGPESVASSVLLGGRRIALFGVPGAFTRTCSAKHLPGFIDQHGALRAAGIDEIMCLSTNDVLVLSAWAESLHAGGKVSMVSDGNLDFTRAAGLVADMSAKGYGLRCRRFSMIVDDGIVIQMHLEAPGEFGATSAEELLRDLTEDR